LQEYAQAQAESRWNSARRAYHELEMERLRAEASWQARAHRVGAKAQADYHRLQAKRAPTYKRWGATPSVAEEMNSYDNVYETYKWKQSEQNRTDWNKHKEDQHYRNEWRKQYEHNSSSSSSSTSEIRIDEARQALGMDSSSKLDIDAVKAAFKQRALQTHPDMPNGSEESFKSVAAAYDVLMTKLDQP
jgi:hypothetical protein